MKMGKAESRTPRDVLEISSDDDDPKETHSSNAQSLPKARSISRPVIEILDSDDGLDTTLREMHEDEITAEMLAQRTTDEMDRLSLLGNQSLHDEPSLLPPESASEGSEDMQFGDAVSGTSSNNSSSGRVQTPQRGIDDIPSAHIRMDVNEDSSPAIPRIDATLPSQEVDSPPSSAPVASLIFPNVNVTPFSLPPPISPFKSSPKLRELRSLPTSPIRRTFVGSIKSDDLNAYMGPAATTVDSASIRHSLSPMRRLARKREDRRMSASNVGQTPSKKERSLSGDMYTCSNNALNFPPQQEKIFSKQ
ncbi:hypothetical protein F5887DRAFT_281637 [Amanita rubescens]|nr:hypothetical protein F5887DRAFT_281637 [Amanita rubescens]